MLPPESPESLVSPEPLDEPVPPNVPSLQPKSKAGSHAVSSSPESEEELPEPEEELPEPEEELPESEEELPESEEELPEPEEELPEPEEELPEPEEELPEPIVTVHASGSVCVSQTREISTPGISIVSPSAVWVTLALSSPLTLITFPASSPGLIFSTAACAPSGKPARSAADRNAVQRI